MVTYGKQLEQGVFQFSTADFVSVRATCLSAWACSLCTTGIGWAACMIPALVLAGWGDCMCASAPMHSPQPASAVNGGIGSSVGHAISKGLHRGCRLLIQLTVQHKARLGKCLCQTSTGSNVRATSNCPLP